MNLVEAEKLIRKAMDEDRKLRQKVNQDQTGGGQGQRRLSRQPRLGAVQAEEVPEAKKYLQEAVERQDGRRRASKSSITWPRCCMALGDKTEAVAAWKKGVDAAGNQARAETQDGSAEEDQGQRVE